MKINWIILVLTLISYGCKEEFPLNFSSSEKILVIEGGITNNPGPYSIRLSTTLPINQPLRVPYEDCLITLSDNKGNAEIFIETEPGFYKTPEGGIQGTVGNEYSIKVITPEGKIYQTAFQEMKAAIGIDSVYAELTTQEILDYPFDLPGYQFYTTTKPTPDKDSYILWNMIETYQYEVDYPLNAIFYYGDFFYTNRDMDRITKIVGLNYDTLQTCWQTETVKNILTGQTANLSNPVIKNQPLHFVSTETKKLWIKYSVLLQQYSISKDAYYFWKSIQDQILDENFLNTKQPYNIAGNLQNIDDSEEFTFGYFTVASLTQKRVFYKRPNITFYFKKCFTGFDLSELGKKIQPVYLVSTDQGMAFVQEDCVDCRTEGGVIDKPDFWIDN